MMHQSEAKSSAVLERLRDEADLAPDESRRARLLAELARATEEGGERAAANAAYQTASSANPDALEPLYGQLRTLLDDSDATAEAALWLQIADATPSTRERVRAHLMRAWVYERHADLRGARAALDDVFGALASDGAAQVGSAHETAGNGRGENVLAELAATPLLAQRIASRAGDVEGVDSALLARIEATDSQVALPWMWLQAARMAEQRGEIKIAKERAEACLALGGTATPFAAHLLERLAIVAATSADPAWRSDLAAAQTATLATADDARQLRSAASAGADSAQALAAERAEAEASARQVWRAILSDDSAAETSSLSVLADAPTDVASRLALLRLALLATYRNNASEAVAAERSALADEARTLLESTSDHALLVPFWTGEVDAEIAAAAAGGTGASAALLSDASRDRTTTRGDLALASLHLAYPRSLAVHALKLAFARDGESIAKPIADFAHALPSGRTRTALFVSAALLSAGTTAADSERSALTEASAYLRAAELTAADLAATEDALAAAQGDLAHWSELAEQRAAAGTKLSSNDVLLILRAALLRDDAPAVQVAVKALGQDTAFHTTACIIQAFSLRAAAQPNARRGALLRLAEVTSAPDQQRLLRFAAAFVGLRTDEVSAAQQELADLQREEPADLLAGLVATRIAARTQEPRAAADVAAALAASTSDARSAGAVWLDAGYRAFRAGERTQAESYFDEALKSGTELARAPLALVRAAAGLQDAASYRQWIDAQLQGELPLDADALRLDAIAMAMAAGDPDAALLALGDAHNAARGALGDAAAIIRLTWDRASADARRLEEAIISLSGKSLELDAALAGEAYRMAAESSPLDAIAAAARWALGGGGTTAALGWLANAIETASAAAEVDALLCAARSLRDSALAAHATLVAALRLDAAAALTTQTAAERITAELGTGELGTGELGNAETMPVALRLASAEGALQTSDFARRTKALAALGDALDEDAERDACTVAGFAALASGDCALALDLFEFVVTGDDARMSAWEGLRSAAKALGRHALAARAARRVGSHLTDDRRAYALLNEAGDLFAQLGTPEAELEAEACWEEAFTRYSVAKGAFDKLFRRVRDRQEHLRVLGLCTARLAVAHDHAERIRLIWESARADRGLGNEARAFDQLAEVRHLDPDHVGALALTGEILIRRGDFEPAAALLAQLARLPMAPARTRVTAGVTAADLWEKKLSNAPRALAMLQQLHADGLSTLAVRERLAVAAARLGEFAAAASMMEQLMVERSGAAAQVEAARLALVLRRDKLQDLVGARVAAARILEEDAADDAALGIMLAQSPADPLIQAHLVAGFEETKRRLERGEITAALTARAARVAAALGHLDVQTLLLALGAAVGDAAAGAEFARACQKRPRAPGMTLPAAELARLWGAPLALPHAPLMSALAWTIAEAIGPNLQTLAITKKDRVEPRAGLALRNDIAAYAGALGIDDFELYVGGRDPQAITAIPGEVLRVVVGTDVRGPLTTHQRATLAVALGGVARGWTAVIHHDDATLGSIVAAACALAKVQVAAPPFAVFGEVQRAINKAIGRKAKALLPELCAPFGQGAALDAAPFTHAATAQLRRAGLVFAGSVSDALAAPPSASVQPHADGNPATLAPLVFADDVGARQLLQFALADDYCSLRRALQLEGTR